MHVLLILRRADVHTGTQTKAAHYQHGLSSACDVGMDVWYMLPSGWAMVSSSIKRIQR